MHRLVVELDTDGDGTHSQGDLLVYCVDDNTDTQFDRMPSRKAKVSRERPSRNYRGTARTGAGCCSRGVVWLLAVHFLSVVPMSCTAFSRVRH